MKVDNGKKYIEVSDFDSYESLRNLVNSFGEIDSSDDEGYTPLCFAILNQVDPLYILLLCTEKGLYPLKSDSIWEKYTGFGADITKICDKGKSPLDIAIMSCNLNAVKILLGESCVDVIDVKKTAFGVLDVIKYDDLKKWKPLLNDDGDYIYEHTNIKANTHSVLSVDRKMVFDASSNPNPDILITLLNHYNDSLYDISINDKFYATDKVFNKYNYTPLMMAVSSQSYKLVDAILENISDSKMSCARYIASNEKHDDIMDVTESAYSIAEAKNDNGIKKKLCSRCPLGISPVTCYNAIEYADDFIVKKVVNGITSYTANLVTSHKGLNIISSRNYCYLNLLQSSGKLSLAIDDITVINATDNKNAILFAVNSGTLDSSKLIGWPWWDNTTDNVTLSFIINQDLPFVLPSNIETTIGASITLPTVTGEYEDSDYITWKPSRWDIGEFGDTYAIYNNTTAVLICEEVQAPTSIVFDSLPISLQEGLQTTRSFKLTSRPSSNVTLSLTTSNTERLTVYPATIVFTPDNWSVNKIVTLVANDNDTVDGDIIVDVGISSSSADSRYNNITNSLSVTITDNDSPGLAIDISHISLDEGDTVTRSIKLNSKPSSDVTVNFTAADACLLVTPQSITFTPIDWNTNKYISIKAEQNDVLDDDVDSSISITALSDDLDYNDYSDIISVSIHNDDVYSLGIPAFESGLFLIEVIDDIGNNLMCTESGTVDSVQNVWSSVYDAGYTVIQIPKSPKYTNTNKTFSYDLLYPTDT